MRYKGANGILHTEDVVYAIKQMSHNNRSRIENVLRVLDARNDDIHHFLRCLTSDMAAFNQL